jgi:hypothetical protein
MAEAAEQEAELVLLEEVLAVAAVWEVRVIPPLTVLLRVVMVATLLLQV